MAAKSGRRKDIFLLGPYPVFTLSLKLWLSSRTTSQSPMLQFPALSSTSVLICWYRAVVRLGWLASRLGSALDPVGDGRHEGIGEWSPREAAGEGGQDPEGTTWSEEVESTRNPLIMRLLPSESLASFSEDSVRLGWLSRASFLV